MTTPHDAVPAPDSLAYPQAPLDEDAGALSYQEINERRARVENPELLQQLRGL
jgi:hypothetical protein